MSISTYNDLVNSVANWIHRSELNPIIPDVIALVEASVNNGKLFREMETTATITILAGNEYATLPDDYISLKSVKLADDTNAPLNLVSIHKLMEYNTMSGSSLKFYAINGNTLVFSPTPNSTDDIDIDIVYYAKIPALNSSNPTNWLLSKSPGIYLYGCLFELTSYIMDDERSAMFKAKYDEAFAQLKQSKLNEQFSGSNLKSKSSYVV